MFTITAHGLDEAAAKLESFNDSKLRRALRSAVMRTLRGAKKDAGTKVKQRYTIAASKVISTIKLRAADLSGSMTSTGGRNPLPNFIQRPKSRPRKMPAGGVYVQNVRGQGGNLLHAFIQRNGQPYERVGASRFPIKRLTGPSAPGMLGNPHVAPFIVQRMEHRIGVDIEHAIASLGFF